MCQRQPLARRQLALKRCVSMCSNKVLASSSSSHVYALLQWWVGTTLSQELILDKHVAQRACTCLDFLSVDRSGAKITVSKSIVCFVIFDNRSNCCFQGFKISTALDLCWLCSRDYIVSQPSAESYLLCILATALRPTGASLTQHSSLAKRMLMLTLSLYS